MKYVLNEDLFSDIPDVEYELDTNIDLEGPQPGKDVGVSGLLLDLIGDIAQTISNYNQLQADLEGYPEIAALIKDFADDENVKLGKVQSALKTISPNAEYIMNGAVEADQELDPGSPLDESFSGYDDTIYSIIVTSRSHGYSTQLKCDGKYLAFASKKEAEKFIDYEYDTSSRVNNFNSYGIEEVDADYSNRYKVFSSFSEYQKWLKESSLQEAYGANALSKHDETKIRILLKKHYKDTFVDQIINIINNSDDKLELAKSLNSLGVTYWDIKNLILSNIGLTE